VSAPVATQKPRWRGVIHQVASGVALVAGALLVAWAPSRRGAVAAAIYSASLTFLFSVSALYHRRTWSPRARPWMRRLDHSAIFVLIAGTYSPFCMRLPPAHERTLLLVVWGGAALGIVQSMVWVRAPKVVIAAIYVALGWCVLPFFHSMRQVISARELWLLAAGGVAYSAGAIVYALRRPDPSPAVFGYHEIFHALTIVASGCHFAAVIEVVGRE